MTTAKRSPAQVAETVARDTGWNLERDAEEREWTSIGVGPVGQHRDSDALERSNFEVIFQDLSERFPDRVDIARFGHWAVGWVEEIIFDAGVPEILVAVAGWREKLDQYPVANEDHWSDLEFEELNEYLESEVRFAYGSLDVLPLTDAGYADMYRRATERISETTSSVEGIGDIGEDVLGAYCAVLASEHVIPPEQLTI